MTPEQIALRGKIGAIRAHRPHDTEALAEAQRDFRASRAEDYIRELVEQAPPLTDEQRDRLALLLRPAKSGVAA